MSDKIKVKSFEIDLSTGKATKIRDSFRYTDEERECKHFHDFDGSGCINVCVGNEPYSCHRAKKEGLCHEMQDEDVKNKIYISKKSEDEIEQVTGKKPPIFRAIETLNHDKYMEGIKKKDALLLCKKHIEKKVKSKPASVIKVKHSNKPFMRRESFFKIAVLAIIFGSSG